MTKHLPITALMLVHRQDEQVEKALLSLTWATEVIVIDNASGIHWQKWQSQWPRFTVIKHSQAITHFAEVRNRAQLKATQPWVFWLDSDEVVPPEAVAELEAFITNDQVNGVFFSREDVFHSQILKHGELKNQRLLRLGRRGRLRWQRAVHEVAAVPGNTGEAKTPLLHLAHEDISSFLTKITWYAKLEANKRVAERQPWHLYQLLFPLGKWWHTMLFKQAWKDGWAGVMYATIMSLHSFAVRVYWWELSHAKHT